MNTSVPKEAVSIYNNALELSGKGDFEGALEQYSRAVENWPEFLEAHNNMGELYARLDRRMDAIESYKKALSIERNHRVLLNIGVEYYSIREEDRALEFFSEALKQKPDFIEGNFYSGLIYYDRKDYTKALPFLNAVIKVDKKHLKANYLLSYMYYEQKEYKKTLECLDRIKGIADDIHFVNRYYGFCYYYLGDYKKAVSFLEKAIEAKPEYARFKKYLQTISYENKLKEVGDVDTAIRDLESSMKKDDAVLSDVTRLSMLYIFKGENEKAEELLLKAREKLAS